MSTKQTAPTNIDEYIAGFPTDVQVILEQIRQTVRNAAPDAKETIKYQMPTFTLNGNLVYFAAFKKHVGFYPPVATGSAKFKKELAVYEGAKGSLIFPLDQPIPFDLISRIVKFRVKENLAKAAAKRKQSLGNMMRPNQTAPQNIDEYIAGFPADVQEILEKIRTTIRKAAPEAEETINYQIPTFTLKGNLVHFAAFKKHIGFYPTPTGIEKFQKELSIYEGAKGSVRFPLDQPIPFGLISRIVKFRVKENLARAEAKGKRSL